MSSRRPPATKIARALVFETSAATEPSHVFEGHLTVSDIDQGVVRAIVMPATKPARFVDDDPDVGSAQPRIALDLTADEARRLAEALVIGAARSDLLTDDDDPEALADVAWMFANARAASRSDEPTR